jgi:hypothetical protein
VIDGFIPDNWSQPASRPAPPPRPAPAAAPGVPPGYVLVPDPAGTGYLLVPAPAPKPAPPAPPPAPAPMPRWQWAVTAAAGLIVLAAVGVMAWGQWVTHRPGGPDAPPAPAPLDPKAAADGRAFAREVLAGYGDEMAKAADAIEAGKPSKEALDAFNAAWQDDRSASFKTHFADRLRAAEPATAAPTPAERKAYADALRQIGRAVKGAAP